MVRDSREHADVRTGSSVRGAIDLVLVAHQLAELRSTEVLDPGVTLDASLLALSGRIRLRDGTRRTPEDVVTELWERHFAPAEPSPESDGSQEGGAGKA
jgi:MoxR-like ATPase